MNKGKLIAIGVGPGDPDLLTLKAARVLKRVPVVAVPRPASGGDSMALSIAAAFIPTDTEILQLPFEMVKDPAARQAKRRQAADQIIQRLDAGQDVAFICEGDVMLYSTFAYLLDLLGQAYEVEIVPGISSVMASAGQAQLPLALNHQQLAVVPATHVNVKDLDRILKNFDTVVLLKITNVMEILVPLLRDTGRLAQAVVVEHASTDDGRVIENIDEIKNGELSYMSQMIVSRNRVERDAD